MCDCIPCYLSVLKPRRLLRFTVNTLRPRQNSPTLSGNIFKCILLNENVSVSIKISWKFVPTIPINNIPKLVQIMAWRRPRDKPSSDPMMVSLQMHICVTRLEWVKAAKSHVFHNGSIMAIQMYYLYCVRWVELCDLRGLSMNISSSTVVVRCGPVIDQCLVLLQLVLTDVLATSLEFHHWHQWPCFTMHHHQWFNDMVINT